MEEKLIEEIVMEEFISGLIHGFWFNFTECVTVATACGYKRIPKSFWGDSSTCDGIMNIAPPITKANVKRIRTEMVEAICKALSEDGLEVDNYMRLFHALTLLGEPKDTKCVSATRNNMKYNMAYYLWCLDDGTEETWRCVDSVAWFAAELSKGNDYKNERLIIGYRFPFK